MAHPHVPKFGNWESGDNIPYTVFFDKAREDRNTGKMINPNDPQENPELFSKFTPPAQPKPMFVNQPEELVIRGAARPTHERKTSRENGEVKHFSESPARNKNANGIGSGRPVRQSVGSEHSIDKSPLNPHYQGKVAAKVGSTSPSWEGKSSYESSYGTPERARMRPANRGRETPDRAAAVPKFGAWENDPSSAAGYTHIFNKVREEKHNDSPNRIFEPSHPPRQKYNDDEIKTCCFPWGRK